MKRSIVIFAITIALGVNVQVHGAMAATKTLYENTGTDTGDGLISSKWVGDDGIHGAADDFKVPKSRVWTITEVDATGVFYFDDGEAFFVDVYIFKNHGDLPGKLVASYPALPFIADEFGSLQIQIPPTHLTGGRYWVSIVPNMSGGSSWLWETMSEVHRNRPAYRNEACPEWCRYANVGDLFFKLLGTEAHAR